MSVVVAVTIDVFCLSGVKTGVLGVEMSSSTNDACTLMSAVEDVTS
jgi:hypothetical protein